MMMMRKSFPSIEFLLLVGLCCCLIRCSNQSRDSRARIAQVIPSFGEDAAYDHEKQREVMPEDKGGDHHDYDEPEDPEYDRPDEHRGRNPFVLEKPIKIFSTDAGQVKILPREGKSDLTEKHIGLNFLVLEPKALLLPQYIDATCVFLVHKGKARLSWVDDGKLRETDLEVGDIYRIDGGTVFYVFNPDEGQRLQIFSILDTSTVFRHELFQSFYVAGGENPRAILSGFDEEVLAKAFQVSPEEVKDVLSSQTRGPIVYAVGRNESTRVSTKDVPQSSSWSFREMLRKYIGIPRPVTDSKPKPYNILKKTPDFRNDYGWSATVDGDDFEVLKKVNKGVFAVSLKAGALLAPHWNPRATEIGLVTNGEGEIHIAFPNGTIAAAEIVREGTVFYIPQYYPMCQIASRSGPFDFMGFSTSAEKNRPQFLAGANSVLKASNTDVLATAFNLPSDHLKHFLESQTESVILPGQPGEKKALKKDI